VPPPPPRATRCPYTTLFRSKNQWADCSVIGVYLLSYLLFVPVLYCVIDLDSGYWRRKKSILYLNPTQDQNEEEDDSEEYYAPHRSEEQRLNSSHVKIPYAVS